MKKIWGADRQSCYPSENSITLSAENYLYARISHKHFYTKIIQFCLMDGEAEVQSPSTRIASSRLNLKCTSSLCYELQLLPRKVGFTHAPPMTGMLVDQCDMSKVFACAEWLGSGVGTAVTILK